MKKECFGILDIVFPRSEKGLREVPPECFLCPDRVECMRAALKTKEGLEMRAENLDRTEAKGMLGRLQRWSGKKEFNRLIKEQRTEKK